jgi:TonB family protein
MPSPEEPLLVPVDQLDRALAGQGGSGTAGRAPAGPTPKAPEGRVASGGGKPPVAGQTSIGGRAAAGRTPSGESTYQITWEDPAQGRNPVNTPVPDLPPEARRGDRLQLVVEFTLTPSGFLSTVLQTKSCGITEVDNAVVAAVRRWTFEPVRSNRNVRGQVTFVIVSD